VIPESSVRTSITFRWRNFRSDPCHEALSSLPREYAYPLRAQRRRTVLSSAMVAYGFSRLEWVGRDRLFGVLLATMMIPFPVVMVPLYSLFRWMGWVGTLQPLWVGSFFANAFNVFLLRQFFRTIPRTVGGGAHRRLRRIQDFLADHSSALQARPGRCRSLHVHGAWNDFLGPLIYLTDERDFTLALGLQAMKTSQSGATEWHYLMAASTLIILPVITLFFIAQRSFIEGSR